VLQAAAHSGSNALELQTGTWLQHSFYTTLPYGRQNPPSYCW
jgi:hypothetical protein